MKTFLIGLILGVPFGMIGWMIKLIKQQRARNRALGKLNKELQEMPIKKRIMKTEKEYNDYLEQMGKNGELQNFVQFLEREKPPELTLDDLHQLYSRDFDKAKKQSEMDFGKELQKWVDSL
tara:strand:- start:161 stop:523 length:363 start_codon:yes stop_codon:yes gene_type:complete